MQNRKKFSVHTLLQLDVLLHVLEFMDIRDVRAMAFVYKDLKKTFKLKLFKQNVKDREKRDQETKRRETKGGY